jgi:HEAT repeat protein
MRRLMISCLTWLGGALWCAAASVVAADPASAERLAADTIRAGQRQDVEAIPSLGRALVHESKLVRQSAAWALTQMEASAGDVASELTQALGDEDSRVRCAAATALGHIGRPAWRAESVLWQATLDRDTEVRCAALIALRTVSASKSSAALGTLSECLQHPNADVQAEAIATATIMQSRWDENEKRLLVPHLVRVFTTASDDLRLAACVLIGDLGLSAAPAAPALASATDDLDEHVRAAALRSLGRFADEVDQHWNQLPHDHRAALRRPCELTAKALTDHGTDAADVVRLAERFRQLTDGIQLASAEKHAGHKSNARHAASASAATTPAAASWTLGIHRDWLWWSLIGAAICFAAWTVWVRVSRRATPALAASSATDEIQPASEPPAVSCAEPSMESRRQAINTLSDTALVAKALLNRSLLDDDSVARWRSASAVTALHVATVPQLLAAINSEDPEVRRLAVTSLRGLGANAIPPFVQALRDDDAGVRQAAAITLGQIGLGAIDAVPQLTEALSDSDWRVRSSAALALSSFGPHAMESVPALRAALSDAAAHVRARAAFALGQIGPAARRAGEELARLVSDPDVSVRRNSASALGGIGADAAVALPALRQALDDADETVRRCARTALQLIDPRELNTEPASEINDTCADAQPRAVASLKLFAPALSSSAEPEAIEEHTLDATDFIARMEDADSDVRWQASQELSRLGAGAVPEMIASLNHRNPMVRRLLIQTLGRSGAAARSAVPALLVALHDVNGDVRSATAECLGRLEVVSRELVQELCHALSDSNSEVRRCAATSLGRFGQHASEAKAALQVAAISDTAAKVRVAAQVALQRITESLVGAA